MSSWTRFGADKRLGGVCVWMGKSSPLLFCSGLGCAGLQCCWCLVGGGCWVVGGVSESLVGKS